MSEPLQVVVSGPFDDIRSQDLRFLEQAARLGKLTVLLWSDALIQQTTGKQPRFHSVERGYFLNAVRYVARVIPLSNEAAPHSLPEIPGLRPQLWVERDSLTHANREKFCREHNIDYRIIKSEELKGFPEPPPMSGPREKKKVIASGCYDWVHSGHIRFFEEASMYGDLYICLGNDANVRLLKGDGHPLLSQDERRYVVGSIKFVKQALITTGSGWLDADPEIRRIKPDIYIVNEDGDKGGKREYCQKLGIEYLVLQRAPAPGLPERTSTDLRGF